MSASGSASSSTRSARFFGATVPESSSAPRYCAALNVAACSASTAEWPKSTKSASSSCRLNPGTSHRRPIERSVPARNRPACRMACLKRGAGTSSSVGICRSIRLLAAERVPASRVRINPGWSPEQHAGRHQPRAVAPEIDRPAPRTSVASYPDPGLSVLAGSSDAGHMLNGPLPGVRGFCGSHREGHMTLERNSLLLRFLGDRTPLLKTFSTCSTSSMRIEKSPRTTSRSASIPPAIGTVQRCPPGPRHGSPARAAPLPIVRARRHSSGSFTINVVFPVDQVVDLNREQKRSATLLHHAVLRRSPAARS